MRTGNIRNKIEILALMDRSGSMHGIMDEAVGAFNTFIETQRKLELDDDVTVTLASFDYEYSVVFDRVKLKDVPVLTREMVEPRGMTALYDSIGKLITGTKYPDRDTVLLIQTDGAENASQEFKHADILALIKEKEKAGWDVNFIGANIDVGVGIALGFAPNKVLNVAASASGMADYGAALTLNTVAYRSSKA